MPVGSIDASLYRDDIGLRPVSPGSVSEIPFEVDGATVVLVDDVLYTGRTVKAALDAITDYGRPRPCSSPCWSTAVIASCRSGPTSSARTCRRPPTSGVARRADGVVIR